MASVKKVVTKGGEVRWRARWRDPNGDSREQWFDRRKVANAFVSQVEADKVNGDYVDPRDGQRRFGDYFSEWLDGRVDIRPTTRATYGSLASNHILPTWQRVPLASIHTQSVQKWVTGLIRAGLSPSTVRAVHGLLSTSLNTAVSWSLIPSNPCEGVHLPEIMDVDHRYLDEDEIEALADAIAPEFRTMVVLAGWTGLRFGELAALRTQDLQLLRRQLVVRGSVSEVRGEIHHGPPKTKKSRRSVPIPSSVCEDLAAHIARFGPGDGGLIFTDSHGGYLRNRNFRPRVFLPAVAASVGPPMTFHDLRHSYVSISIARGVHIKAISERLGHKSIKTTMDIYGHLLPGVDQADVDLLDRARAEALQRRSESPYATDSGSRGVPVGSGGV